MEIEAINKEAKKSLSELLNKTVDHLEEHDTNMQVNNTNPILKNYNRNLVNQGVDLMVELAGIKDITVDLAQRIAFFVTACEDNCTIIQSHDTRKEYNLLNFTSERMVN